MEICGRIPGISVVQFGEKDVVRHNLVQQIIRAYEGFDGSHAQRAGNGKAMVSARDPEKTGKQIVDWDDTESTQPQGLDGGARRRRN